MNSDRKHTWVFDQQGIGIEEFDHLFKHIFVGNVHIPAEIIYNHNKQVLQHTLMMTVHHNWNQLPELFRVIEDEDVLVWMGEQLFLVVVLVLHFLCFLRLDFLHLTLYVREDWLDHLIRLLCDQMEGFSKGIKCLSSSEGALHYCQEIITGLRGILIIHLLVLLLCKLDGLDRLRVTYGAHRIVVYRTQIHVIAGERHLVVVVDDIHTTFRCLHCSLPPWLPPRSLPSNHRYSLWYLHQQYLYHHSSFSHSLHSRGYCY